MKILLQQIITGISIGSIYALIASGYALVYSLLDFSNWAHGEVCMLGAYVCFMATQVDAIPFWLACVIGIGGAAVISFLNERVAYRRIRNNGSPNMFLMIAAMGLSTTYQNLANVIWKPNSSSSQSCQGRYDQYQRYFYRKDGYALSGALGDRTGHFAVPDQ